MPILALVPGSTEILLKFVVIVKFNLEQWYKYQNQSNMKDPEIAQVVVMVGENSCQSETKINAKADSDQ